MAIWDNPEKLERYAQMGDPFGVFDVDVDAPGSNRTIKVDSDKIRRMTRLYGTRSVYAGDVIEGEFRVVKP